ncbi:MAG: hypothetical protein HYS81_00735 [Candidatus Aenigmatarchaeota archaeon]|nr:MAG: hypothetical protein HYS81_00735 [Candidatus Aenigmarchaeota archaeon]
MVHLRSVYTILDNRRRALGGKGDISIGLTKWLELIVAAIAVVLVLIMAWGQLCHLANAC